MTAPRISHLPSKRWLSSCPAASPTRIVPAFRGCQALSTATQTAALSLPSAGTEPGSALPAKHQDPAHPHTAQRYPPNGALIYAEVKDKFNSSRHKEQLSLHCPQKIAATDDNSALREEMRALEPEEENAQPRTRRWVPLGFLGKIGPRHNADS